MDRNTIIGFLLIAAILGGYTWYTMPTEEERARFQREQDSLLVLAQEEEARRAEAELQAREPVLAETPELLAPDTLSADTGSTADSLRVARLQGQWGIFHPAAEGPGETVVLENAELRIRFRTKGARPDTIQLKKYKTYQGGPLLLADPDTGRFEWRFFLGNRDISSADLHFQVAERTATSVTFRAPTSLAGGHFDIRYALDSSGHFLHVEPQLVGLQEHVDPGKLFFQWQLWGLATEKHLPSQRQKSGVYYKYFSDDRDYLSETSDDEEELKGRTNWVAFKQDFFTAAMVSERGFAGGGSRLAIRTDELDSTHSKEYTAKLYYEATAAPTVELPMRLYLGPNHFGTLRRTEIDQFSKIIDLGWGIFGWMNQWLVIPIFNFLDGWGWSYGIIILVLTLVIKLLLAPLTYKNLKSSAKMKALKPEQEAITEKYKDGDQRKKQQAVMDLYRKAGVNPASGCVPMLIQLPILYAMFRFFPASIELRQEKFLWADDLSSYDSILDLPFEIPFYGDHVSLFTLLMAASTIVYQLINQNQMPTQQGMPSMKVMMWMFPIMMLFFLNNFSSGLSYYYLLANIISILQMTVFKKWFIDEDKIRLQLLANMKKPKKKSRWQARLEEMQKQQQQQARKGRR